jgi:hypothetical protein
VNQLRYVLLAVTALALVGVSALALNVPHTFVSGEVIGSAAMNANFDAVETAVTSLEAQLASLAAAQPRTAHTKVDGLVAVDSVEMSDVVVVSIDAPAAGVVIVQFFGQAAFEGLATANGIAFQIDTVQGGAQDADQYFYLRQNTPPNAERQWYPTATQRAYEVSAGTHTFRTEAQIVGTVGATRYFWNPSMTATWYPAASASLAATLSTSGGRGDANER